MPIRRTLSEVASAIGAGTNDLFDSIADATKSFSCTLWKNFPDQITQNSSLGASFARGFMDNACQNDPAGLPAPPASPGWTGGQCPGTQYNVEAQFDDGTAGGTFLTASVFGAIDSITTTVTPAGGVFSVITLSIDARDGSGTPTNFFQDAGRPNIVGTEAINIDVIPLFGGPNNCGDPPSTYPSTNPTTMDYTTIINLTLNDGDTIALNLEYKPTTYNFPMNFDVQGLDLQLDLGGFTFNTTNVDLDLVPFKLPDNQETPIPPTLDTRRQPIICIKPVPPDTTTYDETTRTPVDPKTQTTSPDLSFVRVTLTQIPMDARTQFGNGADNVIYAGWFEFRSDSFNFPRTPINFENSTFIPPDGSTGYAYTLYNGFEGFATEYVLKREEL